jgi:NAD(P)-dependent dehydrogenase (short-subunit alcohol dehydrogenase family)
MTPQTWFLTGCSSGLGRALAEAALDAGQRVIATARDVRQLADLEQAGRCAVFALDVTEPEEVARVVAEAEALWDGIDVIVNNAGHGLLGAVEECGDAQVRRCFETHFFGPLNVLRAALPGMRARRRGHIVQVGAAAAVSNYAGFGAYGGAKAALEKMTESLRLELAPLGIRVTTLVPGPFRTGFIARGLERADAAIGDYAGGPAAKFGRLLETMDGRQPGDPQRAARAVVARILAGEAPARLPLGGYLVKKWRDQAALLLREAEQEQAWAVSADAPA